MVTVITVYGEQSLHEIVTSATRPFLYGKPERFPSNNGYQLLTVVDRLRMH